MGGMSKPKDPKLKGSQKKHNSKTRWQNTKHKPIVWGTRKYMHENADGTKEEREYDILVPHDTLYDPSDERFNAPEPFDTKTLDWREELQFYVADWGARVGRMETGKVECFKYVEKDIFGNSKELEEVRPVYLYRVYLGESVEKPRHILLEIESSKNLSLEGTPSTANNAAKPPRGKSRKAK